LPNNICQGPESGIPENKKPRCFHRGFTHYVLQKISQTRTDTNSLY
jgi:hypothetical protein